MIDDAIGYIAPHHCCGCGIVGTLLCEHCKYNIIDELNPVCIVCECPTLSKCLCNSCNMPYERAWVVGERNGALQRLIGLYKFERARSGYKILGDLLLEVLPELPDNTVIVPIPTVSSHIRERGYDHIMLIARYIARQRGLKCKPLLLRKTSTKQRQASSSERERQAKQAFLVNPKLDPEIPYLIIDDVFTTGSTIKYSAKALSEAGAKQIWVAIIARQTLD